MRAKEFEPCIKPIVETRTIQDRVLSQCEDWVYSYHNLVRLGRIKNREQKLKTTNLRALIYPRIYDTEISSLKRSFLRLG